MGRKKAEKAAAKALDQARDAVAEAKRLAKKVDKAAKKRAAEVEAKLQSVVAKATVVQVRHEEAEVREGRLVGRGRIREGAVEPGRIREESGRQARSEAPGREACDQAGREACDQAEPRKTLRPSGLQSPLRNLRASRPRNPPLRHPHPVASRG